MYRLMNGVSLEIVDEKGFLVNVETGKIYEINEIGALFVQLIVDGRSSEDIIGFVCNEYNVEREQVARDFRLYLKQLIELGHIEEVNKWYKLYVWEL